MAALRNWKMGSVLNFICDNFVTEKEIIEKIEYSYGIKNYKIRKLEDIFEFPEEKFYYLKSHGFPIETYILNNDSLPISNTIKNTLPKVDNLFVIFLNEHESDFDNVFVVLDKMIGIEGLDPTKFYLINGNQKLNLLKEKSKSRVNTHISNMLQYSSITTMSYSSSPFLKEKENLFMCFNRMIKPHRIFLLCLLKKHGLLEIIDWSNMKGNQLQIHNNNEKQAIKIFFQEIIEPNEVDDYIDSFEYIKNLGIKKSIYETSTQFDFGEFGFEWDEMYKINSFKNSYINIVTESSFISNYIIHLTEKSFIPFYFQQIPLILSNFEHNKYLKEKYNFDLFEDIIDYSYDNIKNPKERIFSFLKQIIKLSNEKEKIIHFYKNNEERFVKNREKVLNILNDKTDYNFFKNLI